MIYYVTIYTPENENDDLEYTTSGDYSGVALYDENGELVTNYGDYYHEKGDAKIEGFIDGRYPEGVSVKLVEAVTNPYMDGESPNKIPVELLEANKVIEFSKL